MGLQVPRIDPESPFLLAKARLDTVWDGKSPVFPSERSVSFALVHRKAATVVTDRGTIETNFARLAPLDLQGVETGDQGSHSLTARTLLGSFTLSRKLGLVDLKVLAFAIERWREAGHETASDPVSFTLYQLGQAIYGHAPHGKERRLLRESLERLFRVEITAHGIDASRPDRPIRRIARDGRLFAEKESIWDEGGESGPDPREVAGRRGDSHRVWLGPWLVEQLRAGNVTYLHFPTMRDLAGLSLRLWVFLQAEPFTTGEDGYDHIAAAPELGAELDATLGMNFARPVDARKALRRAAERIQRVDDRYVAIEAARDPDTDTWRLYATRIARPVRALEPHDQEVLPI